MKPKALKKLNPVKCVKAAIASAAVLPLLTGCYDKIELEDRALVISMGIDKTNDNQFSVFMEIPPSFHAEEGDNSVNVKTAQAASVNSAMKEIDSYSGQKLYYGHTKACILGKDILSDSKLFKETIDGLERNREISRKLILMCTEDDADEIYRAKTDLDSLTGIFINDFYKNNRLSLSTSFRQDLEGTVQQLLSSSNTVIPKIENENGRLKISSLAVIKDYSLAGFLDEEQSRGYLWLSDLPAGGDITADFNGTNTALKITDKSTRLKAEKNGGGYKLICNITVEGSIDEYTLNADVFKKSKDYGALNAIYEKIIENEAKNCFSVLQKDYSADVLGFGELIRKNHYKDYTAMGGNTDDAFKNAELVINANVKIKGSGTIK